MRTLFKAIIQKSNKKIHSNQGDSIAEVLIALLISSLALVMLASMITSSSKMITDSKTKMQTYYNEDLSSPSSTYNTGAGKIEIKISDSEKHTYDVYYFKDAVFSVVSFQK